MRPLLIVLAALLLLAPSAHAAAPADPGLRGRVDARTGALRVSGRAGQAALVEAARARLSFRTATGTFRATRAIRVRRTGASTDALLATSDPAGRTIRLRTSRDAPGVVAVRASVSGGGVVATAIGFGARRGERFLGFGERSNAVDQRGREVESYVAEGPYQPDERTLIGAFVPPPGFRPRDDATYYPVPWLLSTAGYGVLVENDETSTFDLARTRRDVWSVQAAAPRLALRVFAGPRPADVLRRFTARTGRQPRVAAPWIFGAWWQPTPGPDPVAQLAAQRRADVPVSVTETFLHYLPCADHLRDRAAARRRVAALHAGGTAALAYVNPMICATHPRYAEAAANGWLNHDPLGRPYRYRYSTATNFSVGQVDFTNPRGRSFFGELIREPVADGFDGWMEDFGEYTPLDARSSDGTPGPRMHNRYPTLYHRTATEQSARVGRPIANYVRSGWTGTARHARIVWGGDPTTGWGFDGLTSAVRNGLSMGLSGVSTWGSDVGGFFSLFEQRLTPELFQRWIEFGAFSGVMRAKSQGIAIPAKPRPQVEDPDIRPIWRRYAKLRTQLLPYLQAADAEYRRTGMPIMRALALAFPGQRRLAGVEDTYGFGPDLLAAPVLRPGQTRRRVAVPKGLWVDLWRSARPRRSDGGLTLTGARLVRGGRDVVLPAPLAELPLLARAGTILPLLPADVDTLAPEGDVGAVGLERRRDRLELLVLPRGRSSARPFGNERVVADERPGRRLALRIAGRRTRTYAIQIALGTLRRPLRPCAVRAGRRVLPRRAWSAGGGVLRLSARGRALAIDVAGCR